MTATTGADASLRVGRLLAALALVWGTSTRTGDLTSGWRGSSDHLPAFAAAGGAGPARLVVEKKSHSRAAPARIPLMSIGAKQLLHLGRYPQMWKDHWVGPANIGRADMGVAGMDAYAILGAVILQVILGLYAAAEEPQAGDPRVRYPRLQRFFFDAQSLLLMLATACSAFSMITFLMVKVNAVTALGVYRDVAFERLLALTYQVRIVAFLSLVFSILLLLVVFSMSLYSKVKGNRGLILTSVAMLFGLITVHDMFQMMAFATRTLA